MTPVRSLIALSLSAATALAVAGAAGMPPGAPAPLAGGVVPADANTKEALIGTYVAKGNGNNAALPQFAFTTIATSTVKCTNTAGCSIGVEAMAQLKPSGGDWAICLLVDGGTLSCQYQGIQGSTTGYVVGNARGFGNGYAQGSHTVVTQLYVEGSGVVYAGFEADARVYKP